MEASRFDKYLTATAGQAGTYPNIGFVNTVISSTGTAALAQPVCPLPEHSADAINARPPVQRFRTRQASFPMQLISPPCIQCPMAPGPWPWPTAVWQIWVPRSHGPSISPMLPQLWQRVFGHHNRPVYRRHTGNCYTGNAVNTVYAAPTTTTNYSVIVTTNVCTSDPLNIPVTVANPISNVLTPRMFHLVPTVMLIHCYCGGNPIEYQWRVSTDGGTTTQTSLTYTVEPHLLRLI